MKIKRIFLNKLNHNNEYPTFENQLQTKIEFGNNELKMLFQSHEQEIMKRVEYEIESYINCDDLCNNIMFPRRCMLTGEWYLREISFPDTNFLSIFTAFIGIDLGYKDDYLGLEVVFYYDVNLKTFVLSGVDSSSI